MISIVVTHQFKQKLRFLNNSLDLPGVLIKLSNCIVRTKQMEEMLSHLPISVKRFHYVRDPINILKP